MPCLRSRSVEEANWSGSAQFVIQYVNLYQQPGSSNLIGWKLEVGVHLNLFSMTRVNIDPNKAYFSSKNLISYFAMETCGYSLEVPHCGAHNIGFHWEKQRDSGSIGRVYTLWQGGCGFSSQQSHSRDFKNGTSCIFAWHSIIRAGNQNWSVRSQY